MVAVDMHCQLQVQIFRKTIQNCKCSVEQAAASHSTGQGMFVGGGLVMVWTHPCSLRLGLFLPFAVYVVDISPLAPSTMVFLGCWA